MRTQLPSESLIRDIVYSEVDYMLDRMMAIRNREGNPEGIELGRFGNVLCLYSKTMPWGNFNTVKGMTHADLRYLDAILDFYRERERKVQFEIVPSLVDTGFLQCLSERGFFQSGFHTSTYMEPCEFNELPSGEVRIQELDEEQFDTYAMIHCRGTGLPDDGIRPVAANNVVLYQRPGWKFFMAYVNDEPAATAVMCSQDGIASLTFAATLPDFRGRGLHQLLLQRRIAEAQRNGCRLVVGQCSFLSQSHRNMERVGMKLGYIRTTWTEK